MFSNFTLTHTLHSYTPCPFGPLMLKQLHIQ